MPARTPRAARLSLSGNVRIDGLLADTATMSAVGERLRAMIEPKRC
jgi:hypothetical protein